VNPVAETFWAELPLGRGVELLNRDANGVAALCKPAGVLSHPNAPKDGPRSLLTVRYNTDAECYEWTLPAGGELRRLWLLNRLDSATSGAILVAADEALAREIRAQFKRKQVRKVYHALVFGVPRPAREIWRDRLAVVKKAGLIRTAASAGFIPAECEMKLLHTGIGPHPVSMIQLEPHTGRSHQLRVQCAKRHLPIVGDQTYGDFSRNRDFARRTGEKRLFLHSLETRFDYEFAGRKFSFVAQAATPPEFKQAPNRIRP
jgi:23S rRNA-/tRNA-specific pseudouridylate synthase